MAFRCGHSMLARRCCIGDTSTHCHAWPRRVLTAVGRPELDRAEARSPNASGWRRGHRGSLPHRSHQHSMHLNTLIAARRRSRKAAAVSLLNSQQILQVLQIPSLRETRGLPSVWKTCIRPHSARSAIQCTRRPTASMRGARLRSSCVSASLLPFVHVLARIDIGATLLDATRLRVHNVLL